MNIKDYLNNSIINLGRDKKNFAYCIMVLILVIISLGIFTYKKNTDNFINYSLSRDIGYRVLITGFIIPDSVSSTSLELNSIMNKQIDDVLKINHVVDAFNSDYWDIVVDSSFANENLDGVLTLQRGTAGTLPKILVGRTFRENENNVAICPRFFYPTTDPLNVNEKFIINGYDILNKTFTVNYYDYIVENHNLVVKNTYSKEFTIVGLYESSSEINDNGVCYISKDDLIEINDKEKSYNKANSGIPGLNIVVDNIDNISYVRNELANLGYFDIDVGASLDADIVNAIRLSFILVFVLILFVVIVLIPIFIKWKINCDESKIGMLKTIGYSNKVLLYQYVINSFILNSFIYVLGTIIFFIIYIYCINNVQFLINTSYAMGGLEIGFSSLIYSYLLIVLVPCIITAYYVIKKCNLPIIQLVRERD